MHDVRLLLWLRARHARSALNRTLHLVGAGVDDGGWGERAYQLYAVALVLPVSYTHLTLPTKA